jgi:hypothetical protein
MANEFVPLAIQSVWGLTERLLVTVFHVWWLGVVHWLLVHKVAGLNPTGSRAGFLVAFPFPYSDDINTLLWMWCMGYPLTLYHNFRRLFCIKICYVNMDPFLIGFLTMGIWNVAHMHSRHGCVCASQCYILFISKAHFTHSGVSNTGKSYLWSLDNPHITAESKK